MRWKDSGRRFVSLVRVDVGIAEGSSEVTREPTASLGVLTRSGVKVKRNPQEFLTFALSLKF